MQKIEVYNKGDEPVNIWGVTVEPGARVTIDGSPQPETVEPVEPVVGESE